MARSRHENQNREEPDEEMEISRETDDDGRYKRTFIQLRFNSIVHRGILSFYPLTGTPTINSSFLVLSLVHVSSSRFGWGENAGRERLFHRIIHLMGLSSVVISLYNYNFCGYEQGLAAHFSYLSNGRDRPQDRFLLAYSEHNRLLFRDLYLMHTYTERSRATKTLFPLLANSLLPVPEEKKSVVAWW